MNFRVYEISDPKPGITAKDSKGVYDYLKEYSKADREIFLTLFFNAQNNLLDAVPITMGTVNTSAVYPREIIREALRVGASSVILAHNHPSGDPEPSLDDRHITKALAYCLKLMQIILLDHVIVGRNSYYSFADSGLIDDYNTEVEKFYKAKGIL